MNVTNQDVRTSKFGAYFKKEYVSQWACYYCLGLKVHHDMHLEALQRVLKHVHLQGREVHRLDKSIHGLWHPWLKLIRANERLFAQVARGVILI